MKILLLLGMISLSIGGAARAAPATDAAPTTESVKRLLDAMGSKNLVSTIEDRLDASMKQGTELALSGKQVTPERQAIIDDTRHKIVALIKEQLQWDSLEPVMIDIYRKYFTQKEVNGMLAFYRSDIGRAVIAKLPQAMLASQEAMQSRMMAILPKMQEMQKESLRKIEAEAATPHSEPTPGETAPSAPHEGAPIPPQQ